MKKAKRIYVLIAVLAVLSIAAFCVIHTTEKREDIRNSGTNILEIPEESITALSWKSNAVDETLAFYRDGHWIYEGDEAFPVDDEKIKHLVQPFEAFTADFVIENVDDYGQYGLDAPICTIKMSTEDQDYEIHLGAYSEMDAERYVDIGDGNVYLMKHDPLEEFDALLSDMIKQDQVPDFENIKHVQISGKEKENMDIQYDENAGKSYRDEDVYFINKDEKKLPLDSSIVEAYLRKYTHLDLKEYQTYNASEEELAACGLDQPDLEIHVEYTVKDDKEQEIEDTFGIRISQDPASGQSYVKIDSSSIIYKISSEVYDDLMNVSYDTLRHQEILPADQEDIQTIEIELEDQKYSIVAETKKDKQTFYYADKEMENTDCIKDIVSLKADGFTDQKPDDKKEIGIKVSLNRDNLPQIHVEIYRYDGEHCIAKVDGETVAFVKREDVVKMIEAVNKMVLEPVK